MEKKNEDLMGATPIPKLIIKTTIPLIISLLVNNLYNLVDSIFVSHVSEDALTGISLAAPLQMIMIALGCGLAVGLNAMVSKALGKKRYGEVKETTSAAIVMAFGAYLINVLVCILVAVPYFEWQAGRGHCPAWNFLYPNLHDLFTWNSFHSMTCCQPWQIK